MIVAYVIDSLVLSGAQKHLVLLVQGMRARGHEAVVFCLNDRVHPMRRDALVAAGAKVRVLGKARVACGSAVVELAAAVRRERAAVIVTVLFVSTVVGRLAARLAGVPAVTCLQARNVHHRAWQVALLRLTARFNACTIANSRAAIALGSEREGVDLARSHYVPNAIEVPALLPAPPDWAAQGWPQLVGRRVIGSIGRLAPQKGYDILLAAFAPLAKEQADLSLLVIGHGPQAADLARQAAKLGLNGQVVFAGERAGVAELLAGLILYVQPSRFEGMPNALMEAMAVGRPVVASAVDGIHDLVVDGREGWLVPPEDPVALAAVLRRALLDGSAREEAGRRARQAISEKYPPGRMIEAYEKILQISAS